MERRGLASRAARTASCSAQATRLVSSFPVAGAQAGVAGIRDGGGPDIADRPQGADDVR
jgi:ABC-type uncharacterized transport system permease subunit